MPRAPIRYWFEGMENARFSLPQNPGRFVTMHQLPRVAAAVGVGALGFRHVDEFTEWLDTPDVAPFFDEFRRHFLSRNMFHRRVEYTSMKAYWNTLTSAQQQAYRSADTSRQVDRSRWSPMQHYLRFTASIVNHRRTVADRTNLDIWPNFNDVDTVQISQHYQAWLILGFLIVREQLDNNRSRSPSPLFCPRTPEQRGRTTPSPTATPGTPLRVSPPFGRIPRRRPSSPFDPEMEALFDEADRDAQALFDEADRDAQVSEPTPGIPSSPLEGPSNLSAEDLEELFGEVAPRPVGDPLLPRAQPIPFDPNGGPDFSSWFSVIATVGAPGSNTILPGLVRSADADPEAGMVFVPMVDTPGGISNQPVRVTIGGGGHIDRFYGPISGDLAMTVTWAANDTLVSELETTYAADGSLLSEVRMEYSADGTLVSEVRMRYAGDGTLMSELTTAYAGDGSPLSEVNHVELVAAGAAPAPGQALTDFQRQIMEEMEAAFGPGGQIPAPGRDDGDDNGGEGGPPRL